jgi:epoxyqueuosine reductase QueG
LHDWLRDDPQALRARYERLYVPRNDGRWLQRNALVAAGNLGERDVVEPYLEHEDELLREHAQWAWEQMESRA